MLKVNEKSEVDRRNKKCNFTRYSFEELCTVFSNNSQVYINIPREDSVTSLINSYLELNLKISKKLVIPDMHMVMI